MSENYLNERADSCRRLARAERDPELRQMLQELESDYRSKARFALASLRSH